MSGPAQSVSPDVSVVIVTWNAQRDLPRCLDSLRRHTRSVSLEMVVVDNASSDGTVSMIKSRWPEVRLVENEINVGFARGCNRGWRLPPAG